METKQNTSKTKVGESHGDPVRQGKKEVLGEVPSVKKEWKTRFKKGQYVYLTAFLKEDKGIFYVCKGIVQGVPGPNERQVYKVKIVAVADRALGGPKVVQQARLLGLICTKRTRELHSELPVFMQPKVWIDKAPKDQRYVPKHTRRSASERKTPKGGNHGKIKTEGQEAQKKVQARRYSDPSSKQKRHDNNRTGDSAQGANQD